MIQVWYTYSRLKKVRRGWEERLATELVTACLKRKPSAQPSHRQALEILEVPTCYSIYPLCTTKSFSFQKQQRVLWWLQLRSFVSYTRGRKRKVYPLPLGQKTMAYSKALHVKVLALCHHQKHNCKLLDKLAWKWLNRWRAGMLLG